MNATEARQILRAHAKVDASRVVSTLIERITDVLTVDTVIAQLLQYEKKLGSSLAFEVGVAEIQSAHGGRYWITTADDAVPGKKLGDFDRYVKFWPKDYFLRLKERLLATQDAPHYNASRPAPQYA